MSQERDILKSLLLKEELDVLDALKSKLLSEERFTQEVASVLAKAIRRSNKKDDSLTRALSKPIKKSVIQAFASSKQSIIDALLPIMGQLIRKTVTNSIKQFVTDINRTIEEGYSIKALKWRWQAKKAGITYPEMLFQKTIRYQVKELFLISHENGLLIEHVGAEDSLKDNNAISAMLTVIQDFIRDSFNEEDASLENVTIKDVEYIFASGPKAYIALVVKGSPTQRLKEKSQELIENVHAEFSDSLGKEELYRDNLELNEYLSKHLVTKNKTSENKGINWTPWIVITALMFVGMIYLTYLGYENSKTRKNLILKAENTEGFFLQSVKKTSEGFVIKGLQDPLANTTELQGKNVLIKTKPYISLDHTIIKSRLANTLIKYKEVKAELDGNQVILTGMVSKEDYEKITDRISNIIGVDEVVNQLTIDISSELDEFLKPYQNHINKLTYHLDKNLLTLSGNTKHQTNEKLKAQLKKVFSNLEINDKKLLIADSTSILITEINQTIINIPKFEKGEEKHKFKRIYKSLQTLLQRGNKMSVVITGTSDCNGSLSDVFSQKRADTIKQKLFKYNIDSSIFKTKIINCKTFNQNKNESLLNVSFKIQQNL